MRGWRYALLCFFTAVLTIAQCSLSSRRIRLHGIAFDNSKVRISMIAKTFARHATCGTLWCTHESDFKALILPVYALNHITGRRNSTFTRRETLFDRPFRLPMEGYAPVLCQGDPVVPQSPPSREALTYQRHALLPLDTYGPLLRSANRPSWRHFARAFTSGAGG